MARKMKLQDPIAEIRMSTVHYYRQIRAIRMGLLEKADHAHNEGLSSIDAAYADAVTALDSAIAVIRKAIPASLVHLVNMND